MALMPYVLAGVTAVPSLGKAEVIFAKSVHTIIIFTDVLADIAKTEAIVDISSDLSTGNIDQSIHVPAKIVMTLPWGSDTVWIKNVSGNNSTRIQIIGVG